MPLIGDHGLLPADLYLRGGAGRAGASFGGFLQIPSVFWISTADVAMQMVAWIGLALSLAVLLGYANGIIMLLLWILDLSIVNVGQVWYAYGWEYQLLEIGFFAIFLCPLLDGRPFPRRAPPVAIIWIYRWLIFRVMLGTGLVKLRGDECWGDLTCLYYYYEIQPLPNPLSWWLHFQPTWFHKFRVAWNHFIELVVPWFVFGPRSARHVAGLLLIGFQIMLIVSGNLSLLNWVTLLPCLACLDDSFWRRVLPGFLVRRAERAAATVEPSRPMEFASLALAVLVAILSVAPIIANLLSSEQKLVVSFDRLHLVNAYGVFSIVGRQRHEIIFEGTNDETVKGDSVWREYEFKYKPGDLHRAPPIIAPYQPRLDWQMWYAAVSAAQDHPWAIHLAWKLLHNDRDILNLLARNPFPGKPPRYIRAVIYSYSFTPPNQHDGTWWQRERIEVWLPPVSVSDANFRTYVEAQGWKLD